VNTPNGDNFGTTGSRYAFTVFTPTYNRAHTLHRAYEGLIAQTFGNFEWLVVDDGSNDNTQDLLAGWEKDADFPIRYFWQENRGKHIAFNVGVHEAKGALFLELDSDDSCVPQALERFKYHWDSIQPEERKYYSAVTALCIDQHGRLVGDLFPSDVIDSDSLEIRYRYKVKGEKWGFHRTEVLKQFLFPESVERTYIPEGLIWNKVARKYKTRFVNEKLRIYWISDRSLVHGQRPEKNAIGGQIQHLTTLNTELNWFRFAPLQFMICAVHYTRFAFHTGTSLKDQWRALTNMPGRLLWGLMLPVGFVIYRLDVNEYARILKEQRRPIRFILSRVLMRSGLSRMLMIKQKGFRLRFYPTSLSASLWIDPTERSGDVEFYRKYLQNGDTVIDVGANIGSLALGAAVCVGDGGKVYAFEAHPVIFRYFQRNVELNNARQIDIHNIAIGNTNGVVWLSDKRDDDQNTVIENKEGVCIKMQKLDDMGIADRVITLMKVDVEGYEIFVLQGAEDILNRTKCVYFESWEQHYQKYHYKTEEVQSFFEKMGFGIFKLVGGKHLVPVQRRHISKECENLLALKNVDEFIKRTGYKIEEY